MAFSPDGRHVISGGTDAVLNVWDVPEQSSWAAVLCNKLGTNMSRSQWRAWVTPDLDYRKACPDLPILDEGK